MFMRRIYIPLIIASCASTFLQFLSTVAKAETDILSYHGGTVTSNGVNSTEQVLVPSGVNSSVFGKVFTTAITDTPNTTGMPLPSETAPNFFTAAAGQVYAEPLVKTGVNITTGSSQGLHDVVFVATSMDSLYAIDAIGGNILWKDSFIYNASGNPNPTVNAAIVSGVTAVPGGSGTEINTADVSPWVGIVGTPVIDGANGYLYLVAKTREVRTEGQASPHYVLTLHKVRLKDGLDLPVPIADTTLVTSNTTYVYNSGPYVLSTAGTDGAILDAPSGQYRIYFNAVRQMVRPALELYNNHIYIASGSHGDNQPYHGWILVYDVSNPTPVISAAWNATPNAKGADGTSGTASYNTEGAAGVWQGGGGVVIDSSGNIYFETGNGAFDGQNGSGVTGLTNVTTGFPKYGNYGDCFVRLALDSTTSQGSQGSNLNGWGLKVMDYFSPSNNHALDSVDEDLGSGGPTILPDSAGSTAHQQLLIGGGKQGTLYLIDRNSMGQFGAADNVVQPFVGAVNGSISVPTYFNGRLYTTSGYGGTTVSWPLTNGSITTGSAENSVDQIGFPGCSPWITANGTASGIVWVVDKSSAELRAYDASNMNELWTSDQAAGSRDALGSAVKFATCTPANGYVYVGTADHLVAYGTLSTATAPPAAPTSLIATATGPSSIALSWQDNSNNESGFRIERSSDGTTFTEIGVVGVNQTSTTDSGLSSQATYYYRVRAYNLFNTISYSAYTNVASATTAAVGTQLPVNLYHFDEGSGTTTVDSVAGNNGTLIGSPLPAWITPGRIGSANLSFSGNGLTGQNGQSAVQVAHDLSPVLGATSSLLFWIKTTQMGNTTHYNAPAVTGVDQASGTNDINWGYLDASGHIGVAVGDSGSVLSANLVNDGQWHHIALTRDSNAGTVNVYVDGVLSSSGTLETGAKTSKFSLIGALSDVNNDGVTFNGANFLNAQLDDIQIYNLVVSSSTVATIALAPAAPTNLVVTPASGTELDLSWTDNANNESAYEVWRSINGGTFTELTPLPANTTMYMNTGLSPNTTYSYFVEAVNSAGTSSSATVSSNTSTPPATPTVAAIPVTYLSPTEIDLAWIDNANNETGYNVLRQVGNGAFTQFASLPANSTSFQDKNVQPGTTYNYHVEAYNAAGYQDFAGYNVTTPTTDQYLGWIAGYPSITDTTPTHDPDKIGVPTLLAYAFNINPTKSAASGLPVTSNQGGHLTISFVEAHPPDRSELHRPGFRRLGELEFRLRRHDPNVGDADRCLHPAGDRTR